MTTARPTPVGDFVPRGLFGRYLSHMFEQARGDRVCRVHRRAVAVTRGGNGLVVALANGDIAHADAVILATGLTCRDFLGAKLVA